MGAAMLGIFGNSNEEAIYRRFCAWRKSSVACDHLGCRNHPPAPQQEHDTGRNSKDRRDERPPETRHSAHPEGGDPAGNSADEKEPANQNLDCQRCYRRNSDGGQTEDDKNDPVVPENPIWPDSHVEAESAHHCI